MRRGHFTPDDMPYRHYIRHLQQRAVESAHSIAGKETRDLTITDKIATSPLGWLGNLA